MIKNILLKNKRLTNKTKRLKTKQLTNTHIRLEWNRKCEHQHMTKHIYWWTTVYDWKIKIDEQTNTNERKDWWTYTHKYKKKYWRTQTYERKTDWRKKRWLNKRWSTNINLQMSQHIDEQQQMIENKKKLFIT